MKFLFFVLLFFQLKVCCSQSIDTSYYQNKKVLLITVHQNSKDSVIQIYDEKGASIYNNHTLTHNFYDNKFNKKRSIRIVNKMLIEDYCVSEADTVYNYFEHDEHFEAKLQEFYNYLEQHVVYPKNALKKGIQAQVKISFIIDVNGSITQVVPLTKHEWGFEESLMRAITDKRQYGFVIYKNNPVKLYLEVPFAFKIMKK